jgi:hypothetical protein
MTYYSWLRISSGDIGGAIAEGILHDIRVNGLGVQGFPAIEISGPDNKEFRVVLRFGTAKREFRITEAEARAAVKVMKEKRGHHGAIFDRLQEALASLENDCRP